ncbi:unnamed protein product [Spirodela intermedia]|uniref:Uncharacterized protein n=1 Tax=Spirodela intermedia TaxID=51605 RepID=A0ABN7E826_SPIIN|nr:unnamed protein product [Spirodela intermedia]
MLLDVSTLTVADLTGRLKAAEDAFEEPPSAMHHDGKLYLTEEEWDARRRKRDDEKTGGSDKGSSSGGLTGNSGRPRGDECRRCGKLGHWARECRSKPKKEQAHVVQNEEEASLLLVKSTTAISTAPPPTSTPPRFAATPQAEDRLRQEELRDEEAWVVDTGATNHMSGSRTAFTELDTKVLGTLVRQVCLEARAVEEAWKWHARLGHVNMTALRKMAREELVRGLPAVGQVDQLCEACLAGKQKRSPFPQQGEYRARRVLELVHSDLCGPIAPETPNGSKYFLLLVDDRSRYMWVAMLPSKDRSAEGESGLKLGALRTDRGGEFTSQEFAEYCAGEGIHRQHTAPYSPQQNGIVERRNGTVVATARSMLKAKGLPGWFWGEAVATAVYILNRCPRRAWTA